MRNLYHDTGTVTGLVASLSSAMFHVFQHLQCIVYQIVTFSAVYVNHHTHAASIMLIVTLVESFFGLSLLSFCHIILTLCTSFFHFACKGISKRTNQQVTVNALRPEKTCNFQFVTK